MRPSSGRRQPPATTKESPKQSVFPPAQPSDVSAISCRKIIPPASTHSAPNKVSAELVVRLAEENASLELALDDLPDPVLWMDGSCRIYRANRAATDAFGKKLDGILGRPCYEVVHGSSAPPPDCPHHRVLATGEAERGECMHAPQEKTFEMAASPCGFSPEGSRGCVAVLRDLTGLRSTENALRFECNQLNGRARLFEHRLQELALLGEMEDMLQVCDTQQKTFNLLAHFAEKILARIPARFACCARAKGSWRLPQSGERTLHRPGPSLQKIAPLSNWEKLPAP